MQDFSPFGSTASSELRRLRDRNNTLEVEVERLEKILRDAQTSPAPRGVVLSVGPHKTTLGIAGALSEVVTPKHLQDKDGFRPTAYVNIDPDSRQILRVIDDAIQIGPVRRVAEMVDATHVRLAADPAGGLADTVVLCIDKVEVGDRVMLDHCVGYIVVRVLPPEDVADGPGVKTGVTWDDIGGLEAEKAELREAIEGPFRDRDLYDRYGEAGPKGVLLSGPPGCVDGDAEVTVNRGGRSFRVALRSLVERLDGSAFIGEGLRDGWKHACRENGRCGACGQRWPCSKQRRRNQSPGGRSYAWDLAIPTTIRCLHNGEFRLRRVVGAYAKGVKPVVRLTLSNGKSLRLTGDHEVALPGGRWARADSLTSGDVVLTNGTLATSTPTPDGRYLHKGYWIVARGLAKHPSARKKPHGGYERPEHLLAAEAMLNGVTLQQWLDVVRTSGVGPERRLIPTGHHVHHRDHDRTNNEPGNLEIKADSSHLRDHAVEDAWHRHIPVFLPKEAFVASVLPDGETEVFDITVEDAHNFVANGIVVHNCGKTMLGKAAASALAELHGQATTESGFQYIGGAELLNKFVGESEAGVRKLFEAARRHKKKHGYPAVIMLDEADALLAKRGLGRMEGMEKTIVPAFLTEMDGIEDSSAFVIIATNRPDMLDDAITRDGRMDIKVDIRRPSRADCERILAVHLRDRPLRGMTLEEAAQGAADELFAPKHALYMVRSTSGTKDRRIGVGDVASGAMCAGLVSRAARLALVREREGGKKGIAQDDLKAAVERIAIEQRAKEHTWDLDKVVEGMGDDFKSITRVQP